MFTNLAGNSEANQQILYELKYAEIPVIEMLDNLGEVPSAYVGVLGTLPLKFDKEIVPITDMFAFTFIRYGAYYSIHGKVPLIIAERIYETKPENIRMNGGAEEKPTENNATWIDKESGRILALKSKLKNYSNKIKNLCLENDEYLFVDGKLSDYGNPYITSYHIDDQKSLNYFVILSSFQVVMVNLLIQERFSQALLPIVHHPEEALHLPFFPELERFYIDDHQLQMDTELK